MIKNEQFWHYWRGGQFEEALNCKLHEAPKRKGAALFKSPSQTTVIASVSAGEFLYDYLMINPTVVDGIDFARADDLSNLFSLSQFASTIDTATATGDMAQLQGYVAEQMMAQELAAAGHDVQFPETSNQAGWDLLVDGQRFQVKCAANKQVVEDHLTKYPETPVIVNAELGQYYEHNPMVMTSSVSREQVIADTKTTLHHSEDLLDFEIPWITAGVSAFSNAKRLRQGEILTSTFARNVASDTVSRTALAATGKVMLGSVGAVLMPGAGAIVFPVVGAYVGLAQGGKLSSVIKRQFAKPEEERLVQALIQLIDEMLSILHLKEGIKQSKWKVLVHKLPSSVSQALVKQHNDRIQLLENVNRELMAIRKTVKKNPVEAFGRIITVLGKSGIHVYTLKTELEQVEDAIKAYYKKI